MIKWKSKEGNKMDELDRGKFGFVLFFVLVFGLILGGYFLMHYIETKEDDKDPDKVAEKQKDAMKIDKEKAYVYFRNENALSVELEIIYEDVVINLDSDDAKEVAAALNAETALLAKEVTYLDDVPEEERGELLYDVDNIYTAVVRNYEIYEYKNYVSLVVTDSTYNATGKSGEKTPKAYVFDITTGKLLATNELLSMYQKTTEDVIATVKQRSEETQQTVTTEEGTEEKLILIEETANNIKYNETACLYIDRFGALQLNYIVKTTQNNYNEIVDIK